MAYKSSSMLFMFSLAIMFMTSTTSAQSPQDFLGPHNVARDAVGVNPLAWDQTLADYAMSYAQSRSGGDCGLVHSSGPYGENLAWGTGGITAESAVNMWVGERSYYNYESNSCVGGECLHYTQVVWSSSVRLGCARVQCQNDGSAFFIICSYGPPGNYEGQRPY